jgi:hypothetical protein
MGTHVSILHIFGTENAGLYLSESTASMHIIRNSLSQEFGNLYLNNKLFIRNFMSKTICVPNKKKDKYFFKKIFIQRSKIIYSTS